MLWIALSALLIIWLVAYIVIKIAIRDVEKCGAQFPGDRSYPIVGNCLMFRNVKSSTDLMNILKHFFDKYDDQQIMRMWFGPMLYVVVWNIELVEILINHPNTADKPDAYKRVLGEVFSGVIMEEGGHKVRDLRKPMSKTLNKKLLEQNYHRVFVEHSKKLVEYIKRNKCNEEFNVVYILGNCLTDIFAETHLGVPLNELEENRFKYLENFQGVWTLSLCAIFKYTPYFWKLGILFTDVRKKLQQRRDGCRNFHYWILDERRKKLKEGKGDVEYYPDFILKRGMEKKLSKKESGKELADFVLGGTDTSATVASTTVLFLAMFPEIQEKAYQEQLSIFGDSSRDITVDDLNSMTYLTMVLKEALRHAAPAGVFKESTGELQLGPYKIPKGVRFDIGIHKLHRNPLFWEKPHSFYPEHFLPEKEASRPRYAYLPFGCGPRACPGAAFGQNSIRVMVSTLLRNFKFTTSLKYEDITHDYQLLTQILPGYYVKFVERL